MEIPMVADINKTIAKAYGCLIEPEDDDETGVAMRATYIINPNGILRHASISDLPVGRNVDETLRLCRGF